MSKYLEIIKQLTKHTIIRYIIGGGTSAVVNLTSFFFFNSIIHIHYILSSILAFTIAFFVSLIFQKFWTFRDHSTENMHIQGFFYLLSSLLGLGMNTFILYICVHYFLLPPLLGQFIAGILTACCTFPISKYFIFNRNKVI